MHVRSWHTRAEGKGKIHEVLVQSDKPLHARNHASLILADGVRVLGDGVFVAGDALGCEGGDGESVEGNTAFVPAAGPHWVLDRMKLKQLRRGR